MVFVSAGSHKAIRNYRARMSWADWPWHTTLDDFSADFDVSEWFGINARTTTNHSKPETSLVPVLHTTA